MLCGCTAINPDLFHLGTQVGGAVWLVAFLALDKVSHEVVGSDVGSKW